MDRIGPMAFLTLDKVTVAYLEGHRAAPILENTFIEVNQGEICTLLGGSGSGKTTLLKAVAGLAPVLAGDIILDGKSIVKLPPHLRDIGYVPQYPTLFQHLSVFDNIAFGLRSRKTDKLRIAERVMELAIMAGIDDILQKSVIEISGGQAQRVSLCRALAPSPQLLLLDEPFTALDAFLRQRIAIEFKRIQRMVGVTTLHVTHDQYEAKQIADQIGIILDGRVVQTGKKDDVYSHPTDWRVGQLLGIPNVVPVEAYSDFELPQEFANAYPRGGYFDPKRISLQISAGRGLRAQIIDRFPTQSSLVSENVEMTRTWLHIGNSHSKHVQYLVADQTKVYSPGQELFVTGLSAAFVPF